MSEGIPGLTEEQERIIGAIRRFVETDRMHRCVIENGMRAFDLHRTQHMVLILLSRANGPMKQAELAERLSVSPAAVAVTLKKMELKGLVRRQMRCGNGRINDISITEKGRSLMQQAACVFAETDAALCSGISGEEMAFFESILIRMQNNLKTAYPDAIRHAGCPENEEG